MTRERRLTVAAVAVLLVALLGGVVIPGVLADPSAEGPVRPGRVHIAESPAIAPGEVDGASATLTLHTRIGHAGNPTDNVSVRFRAYDAESGLLTAERTVRLAELTGDRSVPVNTTLSVAREGGYVVETVVFHEGRMVDRDRTRVSGLAALGTDVRFTESTAVPALAVSVESVGDNRTTLSVAASLTNEGQTETDDLRVEYILRQSDSNLVAARESTAVTGIGPGETTEATADLTVPSDYNYYVDAAVYRDGVLVDTARSVANLDPTETISANETTREVEFEVSDFEGTDGGDDERATAAPAETRTETGGPGFGPAVAVVALLAGALLARRRTRS